MEQKFPLPPFTKEMAIEKIQKAEDAWNSKNPESVSKAYTCLLYTSPSPRDRQKSRMPSSA